MSSGQRSWQCYGENRRTQFTLVLVASIPIYPLVILSDHSSDLVDVLDTLATLFYDLRAPIPEITHMLLQRPICHWMVKAPRHNKLITDYLHTIQELVSASIPICCIFAI